MSKHLFQALVVPALLAALPAQAQRAAGDACAASLAAPARAIYDKAAPQVTPGAVLRDVVRGATMELVEQGRVSRTQARGAAEAAGECLRLIQR